MDGEGTVDPFEIDSLRSAESWDFDVTFDDEVMPPGSAYTLSVEAELGEGDSDDGTETTA